ncbi:MULTISPECIES: hypothetical protein [Thalassobacillus]|uniref:hypothetical protein n=1 Tax=Thalassobacillus TaxID=331971 RepID=UPI000A1C7F67|nr:hypothetical protein [Thalassobacillus devorans]
MGIHWYDWVTPSSPGAALFFGLIFTLAAAVMMRWHMKSWKLFFVAIGVGTFISLVMVGGLYWIVGFYS